MQKGLFEFVAMDSVVKPVDISHECRINAIMIMIMIIAIMIICHINHMSYHMITRM